MLPGFAFPGNPPPDISDIRYKNGPPKADTWLKLAAAEVGDFGGYARKAAELLTKQVKKFIFFVIGA